MDLQTQTHADGVIVIQCQTENLDASNVQDFRDTVKVLVDDQSKVVLDMSHLKFVDSSGLGALIACRRTIHDRQGDLRLAAMPESVLALFEMVHMNRVFSIHDTVDDAVQSYF